MLYKKLIAVWSNDLETLTFAANMAVEAARSSDDRGDVHAYGLGEDNYAVANPPADPHYDPSLSEQFGLD